MGWQPAKLRGKLPPLLPPEGPGYMPLYCAAQYIATRDGTVEIDPNELPVWEGAFEQLLTRIASGEVTTTAYAMALGRSSSRTCSQAFAWRFHFSALLP